MDDNKTQGCGSLADQGRATSSRGVAVVALALAALACPQARAVDGCQVLLCLAAPSWRAIAQCVPPITQLLRDLARGHAFPTCSMAGAGNSASHAWSKAPALCPPQYTHAYFTESGLTYTCDYAGAISISVNGAPFSRTWWKMDGNTSTEFSPAAKTQLGSWDQRFDDDFAVWLRAQAAVTPIAPSGASD